MLILKDEYDVTFNFVLLDAHTHLKINEQEGFVPYEFIRRYQKIVKDIIMDIKNNPDFYRFHFPWELNEKTLDYYNYCQKDIWTIFHPGDELVQAAQRAMGFDFIVSFPANMHSPQPRDYRAVNSRVREAFVEKSPEDNTPHNNFRFIGFGRLDPNHSDALDTFDNLFQLGLRGLKLHPKEENFDILGDRTKEILKKAAHYNIPVIFHTQEGMGNKVEDLVNETVNELIGSGNFDLLPRLKVILGHAPWNGVDNPDLYRILSHPNIFGELSTLKKDSYDAFFSNAKSNIKYKRISEIKHFYKLNSETIESIYYNAFGYNNINYWSSKLMFGSDTPYPPAQGAAPLLKHILSKEFVGNVSDVQNILGVSALKLIPPISRLNPMQSINKASSSTRFHINQLAKFQKNAKILGIDSILEVFPRTKVTGAVFSFFKDRSTESFLFKSLFDSKKPLNMAIPNPHDLTLSTIVTNRMNPVNQIQKNLGNRI